MPMMRRAFLLLFFFLLQGAWAASDFDKPIHPRYLEAVRTVGNITYPPGVCGVTAPCKIVGGVYIAADLALRSQCGPDRSVAAEGQTHTCDLLYPYAGCNWGSEPRLFGGCLCGTRCATGPWCAQRAKPHPPPPAGTPRDPALCYQDDPMQMAAWAHENPCSMFGPTRCGPDRQCFRQTFEGLRTIQVPPTETDPAKCQVFPPNPACFATTAQVQAMDVCCPLGWTGNSCEVPDPLGCSVRGCAHGGVCVNTTRPEDSYCEQCDQGETDPLDSQVVLRHGWHGRWCERSNADLPPSQRFYKLGSTQRRRLLASNDLVHETSHYPIQRICDCAANWIITGARANRNKPPEQLIFGTEKVMLTGNHARGPEMLRRVLLSPVGFHPLDTLHKPIYWRPVGSHDEAEYLCFSDAFCGGYLYRIDGTHKLALFFFAQEYREYATGLTIEEYLRSINQWTLPVTRHAIYRLNERKRCVVYSGIQLDSAYYMVQYRSEVDRVVVKGGAFGNIDVPWEATDAQRAELHWRLVGHTKFLRPNLACDTSVDVSQDLPGCSYVLPVENIVDVQFNASDTRLVTRFDDALVYEMRNCTNSTTALLTTTTLRINSTVYTTSIDGTQIYDVDVLQLFEPDDDAATTTQTVWLAEGEQPCTNGTRQYHPDTASHSVITYGLNLTGTCAPVELVSPERFDSLPPSIDQTGRVGYIGARPVCECLVPFRGSNATTQHSCEQILCGPYGRVNNTWLQNATFEAVPVPETCTCTIDKLTTDPRSCNRTACAWCASTVCNTWHGAIVNHNNSTCDCPSISTGPLCETLLCSADGTANLDNLTRQTEQEVVICECKDGWAGQFCDKRCVHGQGEFDVNAEVCRCNTRYGYTGEGCAERICGEHGDWVLNDTRGAEEIALLEDIEVGVCICKPPFYGPRCQYNRCDDTNQVEAEAPVNTTWAGRRDYGQPIKVNQGQWSCECNFPFAPDVDSTDGPNCHAYTCGYGHPNPNATVDTPPHEQCLCKASSDVVGLTTPPEACRSNTTCEPCRYASCGLLLAEDTFDWQRVCPLPNGDLGCMCDARFNYLVNATCTTRCYRTDPCLSTNTSSFMRDPELRWQHDDNSTDDIVRVYNATTDTYTCGCNADYVNSSPDTNDCSIYVPRKPRVNETEPDEVPDEIVPDEAAASTSDTVVDGMSDAVFIAICSATGGCLVLGGLSLWTNGSTNTDPTNAPEKEKLMATKERSRSHAFRAGAPRSSLMLLCVLVGSVCGYVIEPPEMYSIARPSVNYFKDNSGTEVWSGHAAVPMDLTGLWATVHPVTAGQAGNDAVPKKMPSSQLLFERTWTGIRWYVNPVSFFDPVREFTFKIDGGTAARIGDRYDIPYNIVTWTAADVNDVNHNHVYVYGINFCHFDLSCGSNGDCVGKPATPLSSALGFLQPGQGFKEGPWEVRGSWAGDPSDWYTLFHYYYNIRACKCHGGFHGLKCEKQCPTNEREICSNHGKCLDPNNLQTDPDTLETCLCGLSHFGNKCDCDPGYTGRRCERAVQSRTNRMKIFNDYSTCCPWGSPDCTSVRMHSKAKEQPNATCTPTKPRTAGTINEEDPAAKCYMSPYAVEHFWDHVDTFGCGENDVVMVRPKGMAMSVNINSRVIGLVDKGNMGRGVCWFDLNAPPTTSAPGPAGCMCNAPYEAANVAVGSPERFERRGWFGSRCQYRTCTRMEIPLLVSAPTINSASNPTRLVETSPEPSNSSVRRQCQTRYNYRRTDGAADPLGNSTVCIDRPEKGANGAWKNINTPGQCECAPGWGAFAGVSPAALSDTVLAKYGDGLCMEHTYHSPSGAVCGGYGTPKRTETIKVARPNGAPVKEVTRVLDGCTCPLYTRPHVNFHDAADSPGICERTCVGTNDYTRINVRNATEGGLEFDADTQILVRNACNMRGKCLPIAIPGTALADGLNSACQCNAGWNGPNCDVVDTRVFDKGWNGKAPKKATQTLESYANYGALCGEYGEPILMDEGDLGYNVTTGKSLQYELFTKFIADLEPTQLGSKTAYTLHKCRCTTDENDNPRKGYKVVGNVCARTCEALNDCSGNGTCVNAPNGSADKVCQCNLGFGGNDALGTGNSGNCGTRILHDDLGQPCGGSDRGALVYTSTDKLVQECRCIPPYQLNPSNGLCYLPCPTAAGPNGTVLACTIPGQYGSCVVNTTTHNDEVCSCKDGRAGPACQYASACSIEGPTTGVLYPCTGHGTIDDATGLCICKPGYVGFCCELDLAKRACGYGQPYRDNEIAGVKLVGSEVGALQLPPPPPPPALVGTFDGTRYLMAYPEVARAAMDPWKHFTVSGFCEGRRFFLTNGAQGFWDSEAYLRANPDALTTWPDLTAAHDNVTMSAVHAFSLPSRGITPVLFVKAGAPPGRVCWTPPPTAPWSGQLDTLAYWAMHSDVKNASADPWTHYKSHGCCENREIQIAYGGARGRFDPDTYLRANPHVKEIWPNAHKTIGSDLATLHVIEFGTEPLWVHPVGNRTTCVYRSLLQSGLPGPFGWFDKPGYFVLNPTLSGDAWLNYRQYGYCKRREMMVHRGSQHGRFDNDAYLRANPDIKRRWPREFAIYGAELAAVHYFQFADTYQAWVHPNAAAPDPNRGICVDVNQVTQWPLLPHPEGLLNEAEYIREHQLQINTPGSYLRSVGYCQGKLMTLTNGMRGRFDTAAYLRANPTITKTWTPQSPDWVPALAVMHWARFGGKLWVRPDAPFEANRCNLPSLP
jgi:hypothetical protein